MAGPMGAGEDPDPIPPVTRFRGAAAEIAMRMRDGSAASSSRRSIMGSALVVGQLALTLVLLVGAGLFGRALQRGNSLDPGVDPTGVVTAQMNAESWGYDEARGRAFYRELRERVAAIPGVSEVSCRTRRSCRWPCARPSTMFR